MNAKTAFLCLGLVLCVASCTSDKTVSIPPLGPVLLWEKFPGDLLDETYVWDGFARVDQGLMAVKAMPALYVFLPADPTDRSLTMLFTYTGKGKVILQANYQKIQTFSTAIRPRRLRMNVESLRKGINFIVFQGQVKGLTIQKLFFGYEEKSGARLLHKGESLSLTCESGELQLTLSGRGRLQGEICAFNSQAEVRKKETIDLDPSFPFYKKKFHYVSPDAFFIRLTCIDGEIRLTSYFFQPQPPPPIVPIPESWRGKIKDVFVVLWDGCQANHLGVYGYSRPTAPFLSQFASDALLFRNAYTNATHTPGSVTSLFTGLYPSHHGRFFVNHWISPDIETIGQFFKIRGYQTSLFTTNANVSSPSGLEQGIDHLEKMFSVFVNNKSHKIVDSFSAWVEKTPGPRFSYVHFMEPHFPLLPPPPFLNQYKKKIRPKNQLPIFNLYTWKSLSAEDVQDVIDDYDSSINYVDSLFQSFVDFLKKKGLYDDSLIILLSDHGEALYEHKSWGHNHNVYPETAHVPLLVKFPASLNLKGERGSVVQIIDLFPTLAQFFSGPRPEWDSQGMVDVLLGERRSERPVFIQGFQLHELFALCWPRWYYIFSLNTDHEILFDLQQDPLKSLTELYPEHADFFRGQILNWLRLMYSKARRPLTFDTKSLSKETIENLKTLGYL